MLDLKGGEFINKKKNTQEQLAVEQIGIRTIKRIFFLYARDIECTIEYIMMQRTRKLSSESSF